MFDSLKEKIFGRSNKSTEESRNAIANRALGESYPISIATEGIITGPSARPDKWDNVVLINLMTLSRNILSCCNTDDRWDIRVDDVVEAILQEMDILRQIIPENNPKSVADFYIADYSRIHNEFKMAITRNPDTKIKQWQMQMHNDIFDALKKLAETKPEEGGIKIRVSGWKLDKDNRSTSLLTSFPTDLFSQYQFPKLTLLESHTGALKSRREWTTKLKVPDNLRGTLPFCKFIFQLYGDGVYFIGHRPKLKRLVEQMATRDKWTTLSNESTIRRSIDKFKHPGDREALLQFL